MTLRSIRTDPHDDRERDVLRAHARDRRTIDGNAHALGPLLPQRLRHQHMRDFGRANAKCVGSKGTVG